MARSHDPAAGSSIDLAAYFERIGYAGPRTPSLATLRAIHGRHPVAIAFENLDPLLGRAVRLDSASLEAKLVRSRRGGYCFEHNLRPSHVLKALGLRVTGLAARVLRNLPEDAVTPRGHMLLRVDVARENFIADVGFGGLTLTGPLRLVPDTEQATPHEPFRLARAGDGFRLQARLGDSWKTLYRFDLQEQFEVDYQLSNYYLSTYPESPFRKGLLAARIERERRYALRDNQLAVHHLGGPTERRILTTVGAMRRTLEDVFHLALPDAELDAALDKLLRTQAEKGRAAERDG